MYLRKVFDPEGNDEGRYEIRNNEKSKDLYNESTVVGALKSMRINRVYRDRKTKRILIKTKNKH